MNADQRRSVLVALAAACLSNGFATAEELKSQLAAEIEQRFDDHSIELDESPLEFGVPFSRYVSSSAWIVVKGSSKLQIATPARQPKVWLEEAAKLPRPTLVEQRISKGFPTGVSDGPNRAEDNSYHLAQEKLTFGGIGFSR